MLKIAVFAPTPMAIVRAATTVNPGDRLSVRTAYRRSWASIDICKYEVRRTKRGRRISNFVLRTSTFLQSLITQCLDGSDSRCSSRRQIAGQQCDGAEHHDDGGERERIGGSGGVQKARHRSTESERKHDAGEETD